jgi:hypothetical protein
MKVTRLVGSLAVVIAGLSAAACGDHSAITAPSTAAPEPTNLLFLDLGLSKRAVKWESAPGALSVSGTIGRAGGTLSIPGANFTITFPAGALSRSTDITVNAVAGSYVAYDMLPHGINFNVPVTVSQGLANTEAYDDSSLWRGLTGTYTLGDVIPNILGLFRATEILRSTTEWTRDADGSIHPAEQTWQLNHFSRYMLASG